MDKQRYALITGANGGIGRALCSVFASEGYQVIALDIQTQAHAETPCAHYIAVDLEKFAQNAQYAHDISTQIRQWLPNNQLHCLVNNAAVQILGGLDSLSRADWQTSLAVNLQAPFFLVQALLSQLEQAKGAVVNISSIHAKLTKKNFIAYATSKAALTGMTKAMALDAGNRIRVNAIEPAAIATDMLKAGFAGKPDKYQQLKDYHPSKSIGEPGEVAKLAVFLASDQAHFIHGSCIDISGGISNCLHDPD